MSLIKENIGIGFAGVYPDKRGARCEKCFTQRRNETARFATPLYNRAGRVSRIICCHYHFPEIKSSEIEFALKTL
jgi:hypothetical protein